ncbi:MULTISPECIES: lytic polysaccharide monooxygenase [unclassified Streptomyces]|uniref:lytic polysaccharide monooxygenase n=1 Tax=unclassified Streptomyces TaxID=2593676 RepID=UPI000F512580|nr:MULTISPECIES: lytic polysaccharide monooxygenase [unclassified Streptomyces]MDH6453664.1 putative carbohydrate-binding protein with CBM5 and CBM33 domain [Streptomyces sp. SAI-119]MDH6495780.1 putative carbohydrate-binding protein with CBM5 and CBM33 domain [Streptomyces sp. SAI-149]QUC57327.1 lytic polysaccharide monooxygenase [Streptomyces sp. A2-16]
MARMPWTTARRTSAALAALSPFLLTVFAAAPAQAHGAPTDPVSRVFACSPDGDSTGTTACRAAVAANGSAFTAWDNLRVANVNGRDRQTIPDGKLCSGGLPAYQGLDLARSDWPATRLSPGATLTMKYVSTIPHTGTFRMYLTEPGYDPSKPLKWSDLPEQPFAQVKDPALTDGAYRIRMTLPKDRTGRQVLYTIWQNTSTADTYYSCSDVVFPAAAEDKGAAAGAGASPTPSKSAKKEPATSPAPTTPAAVATPAPSVARSAAAAVPDSTPVAADADPGSGPSAPMLAGGAAGVLVLTGGAALALRLRRR